MLAPADEAWHFGYERRLRRVPVPEYEGVDRTYPPRSVFRRLLLRGARRAAPLDRRARRQGRRARADLHRRAARAQAVRLGGRSGRAALAGMAHRTRHRRLLRDQAGLARTQLEHVRLEAESEVSWLEAYGPLATDAGAAHGADWVLARAETERRLSEVLPRGDVDAAYEAWLPYADTEPGEVLAVGSGWGALEVLRASHRPGTPFEESTLREPQAPWVELLRTGAFPGPRRVGPPGESLVAPHWRDMLETAPAKPLTEYHLGVAQWHAGNWRRPCAAGSGRSNSPRRSGRCCGVWPSPTRSPATGNGPPTGTPRPSTTCARSGVTTVRPGPRPRPRWGGRRWGRCSLCGVPGRRGGSGTDCGPPRGRAGRFRLLEVELLLAEGDRDGARAVFEEAFEVADLREGRRPVTALWTRLTDEPLPPRCDFRMRPPPTSPRTRSRGTHRGPGEARESGIGDPRSTYSYTAPSGCMAIRLRPAGVPTGPARIRAPSSPSTRCASSTSLTAMVAETFPQDLQIGLGSTHEQETAHRRHRHAADALEPQGPPTRKVFRRRGPKPPGRRRRSATWLPESPCGRA